jgi:hypothetical protein
MKTLFLWLTFPFGHILWKIKGYKMFTLRKRKRWWYLPMYEKGVALYFYRDVLWATNRAKKRTEPTESKS